MAAVARAAFEEYSALVLLEAGAGAEVSAIRTSMAWVLLLRLLIQLVLRVKA